jgi:hypothetical protein
MYDESQCDLFMNLQSLSLEHPDKIEVYIDDSGEVEFEIEFEFFFENLERIFGF